MIDYIVSNHFSVPIEHEVESSAAAYDTEAPGDLEHGLDDGLAFQAAYTESTILTAGPFMSALSPTPIFVAALILLWAPSWLCRNCSAKDATES